MYDSIKKNYLLIKMIWFLKKLPIRLLSDFILDLNL